MADPLNPIEPHLSGLLAAVSPAGRRALAREITRHLRATQAKRIADQRNPDGSAFEPRKPRLRKQKGKIRRTMFAKLRTTKYLKATANPDAATIQFDPRAQRLARVHHFGLRDRVENKPGAASVRYPSRQLLGISRAEREWISAQVLNHLAL